MHTAGKASTQFNVKGALQALASVTFPSVGFELLLLELFGRLSKTF